MKNKLCRSEEVDACWATELSFTYLPLTTDECELCHAITQDIYNIVRHSADRPKSMSSDPYFRLYNSVSDVCSELPMRHQLREHHRVRVIEACQDYWEEHEDQLTKLLVDPTLARSICVDTLDACDEPNAAIKDEV